MKKDIDFPDVEDVAVAIAQEEKDGETVFNVYLLNLGNVDLSTVLVSSSGYGINPETEEKIETSVLRHFLDDLPANSVKKIEPIIPDLFKLNNQYWVSFQKNGKMYDKKYIFVSGTVEEQFFSDIPLLHTKGVLIK